MNQNRTVVRIVEDDDSYRTASTRLLRSVGFRVREYQSASDYLDHEDGLEPGCLLLDFQLPGLNGVELQQMVRSLHKLPVVFVSGRADVATSVQAMKSGAVDFLTKPVSDSQLITAVRQAADRDLEARMLREEYQSLTPRQQEVASQVVLGRLNKQIAVDLGITERTVKAHRVWVMEKMHVESVAALVRAIDRVAACA